MNTQYQHETVMLNEATEALNIQPQGFYVDATFGRGGHARVIAQKLTEGKLLVIDKDPQAIEQAQALKSQGFPIEIRQGSFTHLAKWIHELAWNQIDGILFDLGVSSPQLDDPERGFSFMKSGPLDMRMDTTQGISAADWLKVAKEEDIAKVLKEYGEERYAKRIARRICEVRLTKSIETTDQLVAVIAQAQPQKEKHKHFATRSFQAIRIFINQELDDLQVALEQAIDLLRKEGHLVVISFHSLEDRIVKTCFKKAAKGSDIPYFIPLLHTQSDAKVKLLGKYKPASSETARNPRARSAMMRVVEKL